jgi:hypothetical protein
MLDYARQMLNFRLASLAVDEREVVQDVAKIWVRMAAHYVEDDVRLTPPIWVDPAVTLAHPPHVLGPDRFRGLTV